MLPQKTRDKMSMSAKARCTDEWCRQTSERLRTKVDDDLLKNLYDSGMTQEECASELKTTRKVISNAMKRLGIKARVAKKRNQWGEKNSRWKGKSATITNKHRRLYRAFGQPSKCDKCGTTDENKTYDWANLTGDYDDPSDYMRMCRSCHWLYDNKRRREAACHGQQ